MTPSATDLLAELAANRAEFFALVERLEHQFHCELDAVHLQATIDSYYAGRHTLTDTEARTLLLLVTRGRARL